MKTSMIWFGLLVAGGAITIAACGGGDDTAPPAPSPTTVPQGTTGAVTGSNVPVYPTSGTPAVSTPVTTGSVVSTPVTTGSVVSTPVTTGSVVSTPVTTGSVISTPVTTGSTTTTTPPAAGGGELIAGDVVGSGWVTKDSNTASIQGSFYTYGDGVTCSPPTGNPCGSTGCCITYSTILDSTYASWGCGIGLELNASGDSSEGAGDSVKSPYAGTATGLAVTYSNSGTGAVRIGYTQASSTEGKVSPFIDGKAGANSVAFTGVKCPSWDTDGKCTAPSTKPYDIQVQIVGGAGVSSGTLCITSVKPI